MGIVLVVCLFSANEREGNKRGVEGRVVVRQWLLGNSVVNENQNGECLFSSGGGGFLCWKVWGKEDGGGNLGNFDLTHYTPDMPASGPPSGAGVSGGDVNSNSNDNFKDNQNVNQNQNVNVAFGSLLERCAELVEVEG
jgi:hypothetical protein